MTQQYWDPNAAQPVYPPQQPAYAPPPQQLPPNPYSQNGPNPQPGYQQGGYNSAPPMHYPGPQYGQPQGLYQSTAPGPQVDLSGDLDAFYSQRQTGGGKGISWKGVPDGYTIQGVVARPITNGDVFKETHPPNSPQAGQLRTNRDGSYKYAMQVPLKLFILDQFQARDYPEGEARLFLRGGLRDEMTRAMAEVGAPEGPPEAGAFVRVTLTHRKPGNNIATNMFSVLYRSPGTWEGDPSMNAIENHMAPQQPAPAGQVYGGAPQQGPYQQPGQYAGPSQPAPNPQQYAAPQYGQPAYDPNQAAQFGGPVPGFQGQPDSSGQFPAQAQPVQQAAPNLQGQPTQQQYGQAAPQAQQSQPPAGMQAPASAPNAGGQAALPGMPNPNQPPVQAGVQPSGLDPARQALLNRIAGQQGQAGPLPQQPQG